MQNGVGQAPRRVALLRSAQNMRSSRGHGAVQVVYHWAKGKSFKEICEHNKPDGVMEGDIVRSINRLEQACQDLMSAARVMGNTDLFEQFEEASRLIKRDIVFAGSLYVFK
jgi:antiviral helicase SKI2